MPNRGTVTILDGKATPVSHQFSPATYVGNLSTNEDRLSGITAGFGLLKMSLTRASKGGTVNRVRLRLEMPTLETNATTGSPAGFVPPPTLAYTLVADITFLLPTRCSLDERKDLLALAKNLLAHATPTAMVQNVEPIY